MADSSQLKEAIQSALDKGKTPEEIKDVMWKAGYSHADVDNVFTGMGLNKDQVKAPSEFYDEKRKATINRATDPLPSAAIGAIVLIFIIAFLGLSGSIMLLIAIQAISSAGSGLVSLYYSESMIGLFMVLAVVQIVMGILYLIAAIVMLKKKRWGKKMALGLAILGLIFSFTNLNIWSLISIAIYALLVYLLTRPTVKEYYE